ncbi:CoB--CoM heterodisulfide reductase iron-sulfur subunit B family protein [Candidatus Contubernalis alkaliaceticus]|uniref:CoB--CoM heterodisulfide reductase iron-sulfur subunit B family protein n=1 Tax=Candidatus Contubernalis alkaliaceticus TaxID=338645 RepID=UPI001F4C464B|nr:CoB--CoM heterodisulfide reductase iron-sulfur subunit B family protein [Candidatus Contubernalis alkalaceticus]UNC92681.1 CoB--CoM heterodisulfide reductase iron-sulfur subunit B family protein [Candidatus Contubernalis alkalaceticus]
MKIAYYPGCSLESTGKEYHFSNKLIAKKLGIELWEIPNWNCCGASPAHQSDLFLPIGLNARNLAIAEEEGLDVLAPCAACYNRMLAAVEAVNNDEDMRKKVNESIGRDYKGTNTAVNMVQFLHDMVGIDKISAQIQKKLSGLKVACYYGCLLVKPPALTKYDNPENPQSLDRIVEALGAEPIVWPYKTECCGGGLAISKTEVILKLSNDIFSMAVASGADCLVTACPMCQLNLELRQAATEKEYKVKYNMPVFEISELVGLSFGFSPKELGINKHFVKNDAFLKEKKLA